MNNYKKYKEERVHLTGYFQLNDSQLSICKGQLKMLGQIILVPDLFFSFPAISH